MQDSGNSNTKPGFLNPGGQVNSDGHGGIAQPARPVQPQPAQPQPTYPQPAYAGPGQPVPAQSPQASQQQLPNQPQNQPQNQPLAGLKQSATAPIDRSALRTPQEMIQPQEVPDPPKRSAQAKGGFVSMLHGAMSLLMLIAVIVGAVLYFGKLRFEEAGPLTRPKTIMIKDGASLTSIARQLQAAGIVSSELIFSQGVKAYGKAKAMKPGEYAFRPGVSMRDVMNAIIAGRGVVYKITFPEGLTSQQIFARLAENEVLEGDMPTSVPPEGSLMPDTYPFQRGMTRAEVLSHMTNVQKKVLAEIWARRIDGLPVSTPEELVILASIVEKETGKGDERPLVASVFINRLNKGMRLQSDPTIIYGLFGGAGKPSDRPIYRSDIDTKTPYNTYQIDGLPPTPIANPGRASLEAVANPSQTEYLFFVADGTGGHVFAKTLDEHNNNVRRWREIEKQLNANSSGN